MQMQDLGQNEATERAIFSTSGCRIGKIAKNEIFSKKSQKAKKDNRKK